jgi:hypothetical protein
MNPNVTRMSLIGYSVLGDVIPVVWSDKCKIMCGYGSRNKTIFVMILEVSTTCCGHCSVDHSQVEDKLSKETIKYNWCNIYLTWGVHEISFYNSSGKICLDDTHVQVIWKPVLVMTTSFIVSSVGVSTCGLVGWERLRSLLCWWWCSLFLLLEFS